MADIPQIPLTNTNPGTISPPIAQPQAVPQIAQSNPFTAMAQGMNTGANLGFQSRIVAAQEAEKRAQLIAAQVQAQQAMAKQKLDVLGAAGAEYEKLKYAPKTQGRFLTQTYLPIANQIYGEFGIKTNPSQLDPHDPEEADYIDEFHQINKLVAGGQLTVAQGAAKIQDLAVEYSQVPDITSTLHTAASSMVENQKHQDELVNQQFQHENMLRSDPAIQQIETKRLAAGQVYDALRTAQDKSGKYNVNEGQLVDLYSNLYRAQSGVGINGEALPLMNQPTAKAKYAALATYFGYSKNALPQQIGDRLLSMSEQLGNFNERQHATMMGGRQAMNPSIESKYQPYLESGKASRGSTFQEMQAESDARSKFTGNLKRFNSEQAAEAANLPKGTVVLINGRKARIN